jgi:transcriptional regulator with XRE-family HTH domain
MPARERHADRGRRRARRIRRELGEELRLARITIGLSQGDLGGAADMSHTKVGRIEAGTYTAVQLDDLCALFAVLGCDLSVRAYPVASPLRDRAHLELLERLKAAIHPSIGWRTEVPFPNPGDLRAWDALLILGGIRIGVEAETRPRDAQELQRRLALKRRDGGVDRLILLLSDTRSNRAFLRVAGATLAADFPIPGRAALRALSEGRDPGGSAIVRCGPVAMHRSGAYAT